jgi:hypothetical protein
MTRIDLKLNVDQFEYQINTKVSRRDCEVMMREVDTMRELFKQSVVILSESLSLHQPRVDET